MKSLPLWFLFICYIAFHPIRSRAGELPKDFVEAEMRTFKQEFAVQKIEMEPEAEKAVKQFISVSKYSVEKPEDRRKASRNALLFFDGLIFEIKEKKEKMLTIKIGRASW